MERNVLEKSDDCNTFILASYQRKWPRICWKAIGGSHHDHGFETGRIMGMCGDDHAPTGLVGFWS